MITHSVIQKSQLEGASRLDAEYYQPVYLKYVKQTANHPTIGELVNKVLHPKEITRTYSEEGFVFLLAQNVRNNYIDWNEKSRMPHDVKKRIIQNLLQNGDIVIVRSGVNFGDTAYYKDVGEEVYASADILVVRPRKISGAYLSTFLNTKQGRGLLRRAGYGAAQPHIAPSSIKEIRVPFYGNEFEQKILGLIIESKKLEKVSSRLYLEAENLLLKELGLTGYEFFENLTWEVDYSEVGKAERMDSGFFQPKYEAILKKISKNGVLTLSSQFQIIKSKNFKYTESGRVGVLKTKQLRQRFIDFEVESLTNEEVLEKKKLPIIKNRDVLFASMGVGSLGKTNIFYDFEVSNHKKNTVDSTLRIFRQREREDYLPETLIVYLNSTIGQELIYKYIVGTSGIISIYEKYLESIPLPKIKKNIQKRIADLVKESHQARKKSKELLEEAKRKVEKMIEKGMEK